jgi:hypothetical protein
LKKTRLFFFFFFFFFFFLQDCLREGGIPECFGLCGIKDVCVSNRWVRGYRLCRICERVAEYVKGEEGMRR